jgi:hypothetical protein
MFTVKEDVVLNPATEETAHKITLKAIRIRYIVLGDMDMNVFCKPLDGSE